MTSINLKLNFASDEPKRDALLKRLSDGQWQTRNKISKHVDSSLTEDEIDALLEQLLDAGIVKAGANSSYRMLMPYLVEFRSAKGITATHKSSLDAPRIFAGVLEDDAWEMSPLRERDFVNFRTNDDISEIFAAIGNIDPDFSSETDNGLTRIYTSKGQEAYDIIEQHKNSFSIKGLRMEKSVKRRELKDLPDDFFYEFCEFYGKLAPTLLRSKSLSVSSFLKDPDDVKQQAYVWILDAVRRYDETTSIPFAAYLHSCLNKWVHDLSRKEYGRAAADIQLHTSKIRANFVKDNHREPSVEEIAHEMNIDVDSMKDKMSHIGNVSAIRNAADMHNEEAPIHIPADESADDSIDALATKNIVTIALLRTALKNKRHSDISALNKIYKTVWANKTYKSDFGRIVDEEFISTFRKEVQHLSEN